MTYNIRRTDDNLVVKLEEEVIDTETVSGIGLIGRLTPNYGETQSNNFIHILENFASKKFPENPLVGQLCYKKSTGNEGSLYVCVDNGADVAEKDRWKKLPSVIVGETIPATTPTDMGDLWYNTKDKAFEVYDSELEKWVVIGPEYYENVKNVVEIPALSEGGEVVFGSYDLYDEDMPNTAYLITARIIAKEVPNVVSANMSSSLVTGWIYNMLINCYTPNTNAPIECEIIDEPDYELIGTNANNWRVKPEIYNEGLKRILKFRGNATPSNSANRILWTVKLEILKAKKVN